MVMLVKVGLLTFSVKAPPADIELVLNIDAAPDVSPVIVTAPPVLIELPFLELPKLMSQASVREVLPSMVIDPEVELIEDLFKVTPSR